MKRIVFFLGLLVPCAILYAQESGPVMKFLKTSHDFGTIKEEGGKAAVDFEVTNTGNAPLIITRVQTSCGCTASFWTKEPIAPNGKGIVSITYDPTNRPGEFSQLVTVFSNALPTGLALSITGTVIPRTKTPEELYRRRIGELGIANVHLSFNRVLIGQEVTDSIKVYNFSDKPMDVSFDRTPKHISVSMQPSKLKPKETGTIIVSYNTKNINDWGFVLDRVRVMPNKENHPNNTISISANIEEDFSKLSEKELANAPRIEFEEISKDFGTVDEGVVIEHKYVFTNTGNSDLIIRKIKASCGCTTAAPDVNVVKPGQQASLTASFRTAGYSGRQSKSITVISNDPKQPSLVLRLSGTVAKK